MAVKVDSWKTVHRYADAAIPETTDALVRGFQQFSHGLNVDAIAEDLAAGRAVDIDWEVFKAGIIKAVAPVTGSIAQRTALALLPSFRQEVDAAGPRAFTEVFHLPGKHNQKSHGRHGPGDMAYLEGKQLPAGYLYHGTRKENLRSIQSGGLRPGRHGVFLGKHNEPGFVTASSAIVRVRESSIPAPQRRGGGWVVSNTIPSSSLEYWGSDRKWHSLENFTETFAAPEQAWAQLEFGIRFLAAEDFIQKYLPNLIVGVTTDTMRAVQQIVLEGFRTGRHPYQMAQEIQNLVGLTPAQVRAYRGFASNIAAGNLPANRQASTLKRYRDRELRRRAQNIARTETLRAANAGQQALWESAMNNGLIGPSAKRMWIITPDDRLCPLCEQLRNDTTDLQGVFQVRVWSVEHPPLHPSCRCAMGLVFD